MSSGLANHKSSDPLNEGCTRKSEESSPSTVSWLKESILGLPRRLIGSPSHEKEQTKEQSPEPVKVADTELKVVSSDSEWLIVENPEDDPFSGEGMSSSGSVAQASHGSHLTESGEHQGTGGKKRTGTSRSHLSSASATPPTGRTSSMSSKTRPAIRPSSPHTSLQRKPSGRGTRSTNLEVQQSEGAVQRSASPSRMRPSSPTKPSSGTNSPIGGTRSSVKKRGILVKDSDSKDSGHVNHVTSHQSDHSHHSNGAPNASASGTSNGKPHVTTSSLAAHTNGPGQPPGKSPSGGSAAAEEEDVPVPSAFEKVRDTLRISRPKKKKKAKGKLAYSIVVDPGQMSTPEINLQEPDKYQDPFETSYAENGDMEKKMDHVFKPASIPHNKPEYCDHCGDMAWGLYRQVLKCERCNFIAHRKCENKVIIGCSLRLEQAILQHDKQVEDVERIAAREEVEEKKDKVKVKEKPPRLETTDSAPRTTDTPDPPAPSTTEPLPPPPSSPTPVTPTSATPTPSGTSSTSSSHSSAHSSTVSSQLLTEKAKLSRKIREYNRKTTPVHHIHIKSSFQALDPNSIEYHGFVRVHMHVQRPIHVSTAITRTSWYRLMRPVKERTLNDVDGYEIQTAFYLPLDTNRLVHIQNTTTTKELIQILLKKFCVTDNPKKFSLYEEYSGDCRRLFEEDRPLEISLDASVSHRNSKLVLRDNTYSTIQWDAFSTPELSNFIQILVREEELYGAKLKERFEVWKKCIQDSIKEKCMEEQAKKTKKTVNSRLSVTRGKSAGLRAKGSTSPKTSLKKSGHKS